MNLRLWLLRAPTLATDEGQAELSYTKPLLLLSYLALQRDWVTRDHLATLFWPETLTATARRNLRRLISRLSEVPGSDTVEVQPDRLRWQVVTDVHEFRAALGRGEWEQAVRLFGHDLLPGLEPDAEAFAAWLEIERSQLRRSFRDAVNERCRELQGAGDHLAVVECAQRVLDHDPYAEEFVRIQMQALYLSGRQQEALRTFAGFRKLLKHELGVEPAALTLQLAGQISRAEQLADPAAAAAPAAVPVTLLRPPLLAGRSAELNALQDNPGLVLISGEPGVGKTRLLTTGAEDALYCRCLEGLELVPFHPVTRLIRERLERGERMPELGPYRDDLLRLVPEPGQSVEPASGKVTLTRSRLLEAISLYLEQSTELVLFDDLQWADSATLELLVYLSERGRPRVRAAWRSTELNPQLGRTVQAMRARASCLELSPLSLESMGDLLSDLTGEAGAPERFNAWLHRLSGGNPMFALETLRALFEARILRLDGQDWSTTVDAFTRDYTELPAPAAVRDVIRRRTDRLRPETLWVLRASAVLGDTADSARIASLTGMSVTQVLDALDEANAAGLLQGSVFAHDLLRQSVYDETPEARRRHLHVSAAALFSEPLVRATHLAAAGEAREAIPLFIEAVHLLMIVSLYEEALNVLDAVSTHDSTGEWEVEVVCRRASALNGLGRSEEAALLADEVLQRTEDSVLRASALMTRASACLELGQLERSEQSALEGLRLVDESDVLHVELTHLFANTLFHQGRWEEAGEVLERLLERVRDLGLDYQVASVLASLGAVRDNQQRHEEALELNRSSYRMALDLKMLHLQVTAVLNMLYSLIDLGRPEEGVELAERTLELGRFGPTESLRVNLAAAYNAAARPADAARHYRVLLEESQDPSLRCIAWANLAKHAAGVRDAAELTRALHGCREEVLRTTFPAMRARVAVALGRHGSADDRHLARQLLSEVDDDTLPHWLEDDVRSIRRELQLHD